MTDARFRRPPFVWLAGQAHDHAAQFAQIHGAPQRRESEGVNRWILARGRFVLDAPAASLPLDMTSDGRFRAWLNGARLGGGPVRSTPAFLRTIRFDAAPLARPGENILSVLVHLPGRDLGWYETAKGGWQPVFGDGGLYAALTRDGMPVPIAWRMIESDAWRRDAPTAGWGQDAIEVLDGRRLDPAWRSADFDDSGWPPAQAMHAAPPPDARTRGWGAVEPFPNLIASPTPPLAEYEVEPSELLWVRPVERRPELGVRDRLYNEPLGAPLPLPDTDAELRLATTDGADLALMVAFDPYRVGRPFIEFTAQGGEIVEIAIDEALPGEFGRGRAGAGIQAQDRLWVAHIARYVARAGRQRFEWFAPGGMRAMQLVLRDAPQSIIVHRLGLVACHHDTAIEGTFASGDALLDTLWERGRHTLLMCAQDGWIDCPGRESRQWLGDGVVMFDMAAYAIGPGIYPLHRQFLDQVAEGQRADGLARMISPGDLPASVTIVDYTLHWLIGVARYLEVTGDMASAERWLPAFERALAWFDRAGDASGLIADVPEWHFIEWADLGREGWSLPFNALYAGALRAVERIAALTGRSKLRRSCAARYKAVRAAVNAHHWDAARGLYVDSVEPGSGRQRPRASQHGNALTLLFDLAPPARARRALAAITDRARLQLTNAPPIMVAAGPFDEARQIVRANTFFSHFVYDAIARAGRVDWVVDDLRALYGPMLEAGATTLWESFTPAASLCHGFSATPVYQLSRHLIGIAPVTPGYVTFSVTDPGETGLAATGTVPTVHGPIHAAWSAGDGVRRVDIEHPACCRPVPGKGSVPVEEQIGETRSWLCFKFQGISLPR